MDYKKFLQLLNQDNSEYACFAHTVQIMNDEQPLLFAPKGRDLIDVVRSFITKGSWPVVDKRLQMVIGLKKEQHSAFISFLTAYYVAEKQIQRTPKNSTMLKREWYLDRGMGYYISSMQPHVIHLGIRYREDRYDKDLFPFFDLDYAEQEYRFAPKGW